MLYGALVHADNKLITASASVWYSSTAGKTKCLVIFYPAAAAVIYAIKFSIVSLLLATRQYSMSIFMFDWLID